MRGRATTITDDYTLQIKAVRSTTGKIVQGLIIGNTLYQNQALILAANKGEFKQNPALGVGIEGVLLDNDYLEWRRKIRLQLEMDGQTVTTITFNSTDNLTIHANYKNR